MDDGSADLDGPPAGNGRFEGANPIGNISPSALINPVTTNGDHRVVFPATAIVPLAFHARDNDRFLFPSTMDGTVTEITRLGPNFRFKLNITAHSENPIDWPDFIGGTIEVGGGAAVKIISGNRVRSEVIAGLEHSGLI